MSASSVVDELMNILDRLEPAAMDAPEPKAVDVLGRLLVRFPTELIVLEREHVDRAGVCAHCRDARSWPCMFVCCAWDARVTLGWPLPSAAQGWAGHAG